MGRLCSYNIYILQYLVMAHGITVCLCNKDRCAIAHARISRLSCGVTHPTAKLHPLFLYLQLYYCCQNRKLPSVEEIDRRLLHRSRIPLAFPDAPGNATATRLQPGLKNAMRYCDESIPRSYATACSRSIETDTFVTARIWISLNQICVNYSFTIINSYINIYKYALFL